MKSPTISGIIFDFDGTLVDTVDDIASAMNTVLQTYGYSGWPEEQYRQWVGQGTRQMIRQASPQNINQQEVYEKFTSEYEAHCLEKTRIFTGINELLTQLLHMDMPLSILSNKSQKLLRYMTNRLFPEKCFISVVGVTQDTPVKPAPGHLNQIIQKMNVSPEQCLMIGDTSIDIKAGQNAGVSTLAVEWGYQNKHILAKEHPDYFAAEPCEILNIFY